MRLGKTHFQKQSCYWVTFKPNISLDNYLKIKKPFKFNGYIRRGAFVDELFCDYRKMLFPQQNFSYQNATIFRIVLRDVNKYIEKSGTPKLAKPRAATFWNEGMLEYKGRVTATDLNHAYWRIAFLKGYISEQTYNKGLEDEVKPMRNSALANLTSQKEWFLLRDGEVTKTSFVIRKDDALSIIYNDIRYTCYEIMHELRLLLGKDFICYKIDCLYYVDTKKNRKLVQDFITERGIEWKQLEETNINNHKKQKKHEKSNSIN